MFLLLPAHKQGVANDSGTDGGSCCELEVALQWLNVLYARECQAEAGEGSAGAAEGQRAPHGAGSRSSGRASPGAVGSSPYETTLQQLLLGLRQALPPSSKVIVRWVGCSCSSCAHLPSLFLALAFSQHTVRSSVSCLLFTWYPPYMLCRVLLEAPALPMPAVRQFLQQVAEGGPDWCTLALLAARDVILQRPPSREPLVQLVLDACAAPTSDTRSKAVRLVANRLFSDPGMAPQIEESARQRLDAMLLPTVSPAAVATAPEAEGGAGSPSAQAAAPAVEAAAAASAAGEEAAAGCSGNPQQATAGAGAEEAPAAPSGPSDIEAAQLCALYCALCTKKHSLLRHLFEVYGQTSGRWLPTAFGRFADKPFITLQPRPIAWSTHCQPHKRPANIPLLWLAPFVQMAAARQSSETPGGWPRPSAPAPQPCWRWSRTRRLAACRWCCRCCTC